MSRVRGRDTKPELFVRRSLHQAGYRFRLHVAGLPGKPDLCFPARGKIILVHGCYWHGHSCRYGLAQSKTNRRFWQAKLERNRRRDRKVIRRLRSLGWKVLVIWECQIKRGAWEGRATKFLGPPRS